MDSINYVGKLKEYADRARVTVSYEDIGSDGPDHIRRFTIRAVVNGEAFPEGVGNNKKEAKKNAARNAWISLTAESADSVKTENVAEASSSGLKAVSYVSWLHDFGQKNRLAVRPVESLSVGAAFHSQLCSFVVGDKEYPAASGKTKKEAKEEAARLVYEEMFGSESVDTGLGKESFTSPERREPLDEASSEFCDQMKSLSIKDADGSFTPTNYIQTINLFCQQKKLLPTYVEERRAGPPHNPTFFYKLLLNKQEYPVGEGRSVKEAKQKAAQLAWSIIKEQSETPLVDSGRSTISTPTSTKDSGQVHSSSGSDWIKFKSSSQPSKSRKGRTPESRPKVKLAANFGRARSQSKEDGMNFNGKGESDTEEAQTPLMNGRFTSEYDCMEGLGRGKFGLVYKAKRKLEGNDCAVKIVRYKKEALQEVKVLSDLNHGNIVRYFSCWIEDSAPPWDGSTDSSSSAQSSSDSSVKYLYIQMELCDTRTLREWIDEKNKQDPKKSLRKRREEGLTIALQIVSGVEYIHSMTLIHRDLKPANILFDRSGRVKIGDFGLVTAEIEDDAENQKERSGYKGTPSYMAPEQKRKTLYNNKVDIFALGLIYFELLWNFPTFHERNENWNDIRQQNFPGEFRSHFYEESRIIKSMLCFHPKDRPEASKLKVKLEKWKTNLAVLQTMERDSRTL